MPSVPVIFTLKNIIFPFLNEIMIMIHDYRGISRESKTIATNENGVSTDWTKLVVHNG